jgi:hypothetical protein
MARQSCPPHSVASDINPSIQGDPRGSPRGASHTATPPSPADVPRTRPGPGGIFKNFTARLMAVRWATPTSARIFETNFPNRRCLATDTCPPPHTGERKYRKMNRHPLNLTQEQLAIVNSALATVPAAWRARAGAAIADALIGRPVTNCAVRTATGNVTRAVILGAGSPTLGTDD